MEEIRRRGGKAWHISLLWNCYVSLPFLGEEAGLSPPNLLPPTSLPQVSDSCRCLCDSPAHKVVFLYSSLQWHIITEQLVLRRRAGNHKGMRKWSPKVRLVKTQACSSSPRSSGHQSGQYRLRLGDQREPACPGLPLDGQKPARRGENVPSVRRPIIIPAVFWFVLA